MLPALEAAYHNIDGRSGTSRVQITGYFPASVVDVGVVVLVEVGGVVLAVDAGEGEEAVGVKVGDNAGVEVRVEVGVCVDVALGVRVGVMGVGVAVDDEAR
jgi:hypothetical protein